MLAGKVSWPTYFRLTANRHFTLLRPWSQCHQRGRRDDRRRGDGGGAEKERENARARETRERVRERDRERAGERRTETTRWTTPRGTHHPLTVRELTESCHARTRHRRECMRSRDHRHRQAQPREWWSAVAACVACSMASARCYATRVSTAVSRSARDAAAARLRCQTASVRCTSRPTWATFTSATPWLRCRRRWRTSP